MIFSVEGWEGLSPEERIIEAKRQDEEWKKLSKQEQHEKIKEDWEQNKDRSLDDEYAELGKYITIAESDIEYFKTLKE